MKTISLRNFDIDVLRGLCILAVILLHSYIRMPLGGTLLPQSINHIIFYSGYYGVIIFFVISGFLITRTSLDKWGALHKININDFYRFRFARIAPCLLGLIIILSFLDLMSVKGFIIDNTTLSRTVFAALTFHINWLEAQVGYLPGTWDVLWSLSIEEIFYLFFPLFCLLVRKNVLFKLGMFVFIILGPLARTVFSHNDIWSDHSYLSCMDGIAIGCLAALYFNQRQFQKKILIRYLYVGILLSMFVFLFRGQVFKLGLTSIGLNVTLLEVSIAFILIGLQYRNTQQPKYVTVIFQWFGKNSYEVYLTHMFSVMLIAVIYKSMPQYIWVTVTAYLTIIALSGLLGHFIANYYSKPMNTKLRLMKKSILSIEMYQSKLKG